MESSIPQLITAAATSLAAVATVAVVVLAIWGSKIVDWLRDPRLEFHLSENRGEHVISRDSPYQTDFPGHWTLWDASNYKTAS